MTNLRMKKQCISKLACVAAAGLISVSAHTAPITADVVFVVDESGSMGGEHAWLSDMIGSMESGLNSQGVGVSKANRYSLVGFGGDSADGHFSGHAHDMDNATTGDQYWGNDSQFVQATSTLVTDGGTEDGWQALDWAINQLSYRPDAAVNFVLVTDEDRDNEASVDKQDLLNGLGGLNALLNVVVDNEFGCNSTTGAIGIDAGSNGFEADGNGLFTKCAGAGKIGDGDDNTTDDYVQLALNSGGAAWDLNILRAGGNDAESFTNAFVDTKVQEITEQPPTSVPEPGTLALFGLGLAGLGLRRLQS